MNARWRERLLMLCLLASAAEARAADFLSVPQAQRRPWPVLENSMTTLDMRLYAVRTDQPPTLDGKLDEPAWQQAFSVSTFGREAFKGYTPRRNSVRFLYDDKALYVGCTGEISGWQGWRTGGTGVPPVIAPTTGGTPVPPGTSCQITAKLSAKRRQTARKPPRRPLA
jgi:hypothetical protein